MIANTGKLAGKTLFVTGASRGIGKAIALKAAKDGANIVIAAKTAEPHPKLPGTIYSAAEEVEKIGGKALPCIVDIRDQEQVENAIQEAVKKFGGIDILINNASAISLTESENTEMKKYDLMQNINARGTFLVTKFCLPYLKMSNHSHVLNLSPPLNLNPKWFANHVAYTIAKYGMSMCVLGMSEEFKPYNIAVNALWPKTAIDTAAIKMMLGTNASSRKPDIVADAAYVILCKNPSSFTGKFCIDEDVVLEAGVDDLKPYACNPANANDLLLDGFMEMSGKEEARLRQLKKAFVRHYHTSTMHRKQDAKQDADTQIVGLFQTITKSLSEELVKKTQAVFQFNVKGNELTVWHLDLKNGCGACGQGAPPAPPDATLTMESGHFADMFAGKLSPASAFMSGKLKISGDMSKALKLEKLMKSLKSKL